jgi:hypothetical protein
MKCPFPGMDPYIERPAIWADFHDRLITHICEMLQPLLRPRYLAITQERLYVVESDRPIRPDIGITRGASTRHVSESRTAVLEPDAPAIFDLWREEIREPLIHIVDPAENNRVVTAIEVLSPANKATGTGRTNYLQKREEFWNSGTNLVEIDLLRDGDATVRVSAEKLAELGAWRYLVAVTRHWPARQEVYAVPLERRLPRVGIPLAGSDPDVTLDLQAAFNRCWEAGPYPDALRYDNPPPGKPTAKEMEWCDLLLKAAKLREA